MRCGKTNKTPENKQPPPWPPHGHINCLFPFCAGLEKVLLILYGVEVKVAQSCLTLHDPMDYAVHGILARILKWVAVPFSRGSSQPQDRTQVSPIAGRFFTSWATSMLVLICPFHYKDLHKLVNIFWVSSGMVTWQSVKWTSHILLSQEYKRNLWLGQTGKTGFWLFSKKKKP